MYSCSIPKIISFLANFFAVFDETHLGIELVKLAVQTIGTRVFVTKTCCQLVIARHTADHQQLLELLWRLRQRIEFPFVQS